MSRSTYVLRPAACRLRGWNGRQRAPCVDQEALGDVVGRHQCELCVIEPSGVEGADLPSKPAELFPRQT